MNYDWNCSELQSTTSTEAEGVPGCCTAASGNESTSAGRWAGEGGLHDDSIEYDQVIERNGTIVVGDDTGGSVFHPDSLIAADDAWPEEDPPKQEGVTEQGVVVELLKDEGDEDDAPQSVFPTSPAASSPSPSLIEGGRGDVSTSPSLIEGGRGDVSSSLSVSAARQEDWSLGSDIMNSRQYVPGALVAAGGADKQIEFDSFALMIGKDSGPGPGVECEFGEVKSFAPSITGESLRLMLARAAHCRHFLAGWGVCEAFLNPGKGGDQVYYAYPPPCNWLLCREASIEFERGQVLKLERSIKTGLLCKKGR
jgi:hypothetical protein